MTGESHRYTDLPDNVDGHRGERRVGKTLDDMRDEQLHFWCSLDIIPGINDIDLLLVHEQIGAFVVEIKAVSLDAVRLYELGHCRLEGRAGAKTPLRQAKIARDQLAAYLRDAMPCPPFLVATACWPEITRKEWTSRWTLPALIRQAEGMIFRDDLRGPSELRACLQTIRLRPGIGSPSERIAPASPVDLDGLDQTLRATPSGARGLTKSGYEQ